MSLSASIKFVVGSEIKKTVGSSEIVANCNARNDMTLTAPTLFYTVAGTIPGGGAISYDLSGALTNPLGDAAVFAKVQAVYIRSLTGATFTVGGAQNIGMLGAGDLLNVPLLGVLGFAVDAGIAVANGASDLITITGTAASTFELIVIGQ